MRTILLLSLHAVLASPSSPSPAVISTQQHQQPPNQQSKLNNLVTLDLAGRIDIHLSSPFDSDDNDFDDGKAYSTTPIFQWGDTTTSTTTSSSSSKNYLNLKKPNIHVGGEYNFKNVWYGLTRAIATLSWGPMNARQYSNCHIHGSGSRRNSLRLQPQSSISKTLSVEKGLLSPKDYAINFGIAFPTTKTLMDHYFDNKNGNQDDEKIMQSPSSAVVRYETMNPNHENEDTTSIIVRSTFLHPRIQLVGKSILKMGQIIHANKIPTKFSPFLSRIEQRQLNLNDESSWIPDIKMTPSGKVISDSTFGFPLQSQTSLGSNNNNIGVRFMVKKQINWNILGSLFQQDSSNGGNAISSSHNDYDELDNDTIVRLEVCGLTGKNSLSSVAIDAVFERLKETLHCTIAQERVIN